MNPATRATRKALAAAALTSVAALAAGCGGAASPAAAPTVRITVTVAPATSHSAAPPAQSSAPAPQNTPPGPPPCATRDLKVTVGPSQGTAGSVYTALDFTNISSSTCTLYGYPGVSLAGGSPVKQIGKAANEDPATARELITLQPNVTGNALLKIGDALNYPAATCHPVNAHYLQIYPPNETTPVYLAYRAKACAKPVNNLLIAAMRAGSGSS